RTNQLVIAVNGKVRQVHECLFVRRVGKGDHRLLGARRLGLRPAGSVCDGPCRFNRIRYRLDQRVIALLYRSSQQFALLGVGVAQRMDQGQGRFSLREVIADVFAKGRVVSPVVQGVVHQLEGYAQVKSIPAHGRFYRAFDATDNGGKLRGCFKELRRFAPNDIHVSLFRGIRVVAVQQLEDLSSRDRVRGSGQDLHDAHLVHLDHHFKGAGVEKIPYKYARFVAPDRVRGGLTAAHFRGIDDVIVKEGGSVNELDNRGELDVSLAPVAERSGAEQHDNGAQALPSAINNVPRQLINKEHVRPEAKADLAVDGCQIVFNERLDGFKFHAGWKAQ